MFLKRILFPSLIIVLHPRKRLSGIVSFRGKQKWLTFDRLLHLWLFFCIIFGCLPMSRFWAVTYFVIFIKIPNTLLLNQFVHIFYCPSCFFLQNSTSPPLKLSNVERITNVQILILFCILIAMSLICSVGSAIWNRRHSGKDWYLNLNCKH